MAANSNSNSLSNYLEQQQGTTFKKLYLQPSTSFAIFRRMLPHLAKTIVMAILYMPTPFLISDLEIWVKPTARREKDQAISILRTLHIVTITNPTKDTPQSMYLTTNFKNSLRLALEGGGEHNSFGVPSTQPISDDIDLAFLDRYARQKWDGILHFVVNSVGFSSSEKSANGPKQSVKDLLLSGHLVERKTGSMSITQTGFTFLLQESNAQVWTLLLLWLAAADAKNNPDMESVDMLSFFFLLASLELGRAYNIDALTEARQNMLPILIDFGLVYIPQNNRHQFFPTRLATTLTSGDTTLRSVSMGFQAASETGFGDVQDKNSIVLETNFRMYAYVHSPLQIAVLALFSDLKVRFRGMVQGVLTRGSVRRAIDMGISSDEIISYLATHAHDQMHRVAVSTNKPLLPPVVIDQIRLWQLDTERMLTTGGYLFKEFDDENEYKAICNFADDIGVVSWRDDKKGMFFANKVDQIKDFMRTRKKASK